MTAEPPPIGYSGAPEPRTPDSSGQDVPAAPATPMEQPGAHSSTPDTAEIAPTDQPTSQPAAEPVCGVPRDQARAAKASLGQDLSDDPEFRGVGLSREDDGSYVLVVNVSSTEALTRVPGLVEGTPVRTRVTGEIHILPEQPGPG